MASGAVAWVGAAVIAGVAAACGSGVALDNLGPRELVMTYYSSLEKGDTSTARGCLAASFALREALSPDSDFVNLQSIRNVSIGEDRQEGTAGTAFGNYYELREMPVTFDAVYKQVITAQSGHQTAFVMVGKASKNSPWRIVSIGSGP